MTRKHDNVLGHSDESDGIEEYDNPLPDWWLGMFFFTIIFGIGYAVEYHMISGRSQSTAYEVEMAAAAVRWPQSEAPKELSMDAATVAAGKEIYATTCASCHGPALEGGIGPNLKDAEWIHGGQPADIVKTVSEGVAAKGMPAWGQILGPDKVAKVSSFVVSSNTGEAPKAKEPPPPTEAPADVPADPVEAGAQVFAQNCVACHGADMTGGVGPNLVDAEWIHGGELAQISAVITNGVPEKGMVAWGPILGEEKIAQVARFVHQKANGTAAPAGDGTATN